MSTTQQPASQPSTASRVPTTGTVVVVTYNSTAHIRECLEAVKNADGLDRLHLLVVDNASSDHTVEAVRSAFPDVDIIETGANLGLAAANNLARQHAVGDYLFLLNPDTRVAPDAFTAAMAIMDRTPDCGMAGGLLLDEAGNRQPSARRFPTPLGKLFMQSGLAERFPDNRLLGGWDYRWFDHRTAMDVDWVPGAFTCIRQKLLKDIGFFDERFFLYFEETDLCRRTREAGWTVRFLPEVQVFHEGGGCGKTVKQEAFDVGGSQVMKFRMRAECLYHQKYGGTAAVLANLGVEWLWHRLRVLANVLPRPRAQAKRNYSRGLARQIEQALRDTRLGKVCPPKPW